MIEEYVLVGMNENQRVAYVELHQFKENSAEAVKAMVEYNKLKQACKTIGFSIKKANQTEVTNEKGSKQKVKTYKRR